MKEMSSFYQICVYITLVMILFNLSVSAVNALGVFYPVETGIEMSDDADENFETLTNISSFSESSMTGIQSLWILFTGSAVSLVAGFFLMWLTRSTTILGVALFSGVFWSSYFNMLSVVNVGGFLTDLSMFILIGTVGMIFIFAAAVIGMLSGSG